MYRNLNWVCLKSSICIYSKSFAVYRTEKDTFMDRAEGFRVTLRHFKSQRSTQYIYEIILLTHQVFNQNFAHIQREYKTLLFNDEKQRKLAFTKP